MSTDALRPGEIDLEAPAGEQPAGEQPAGEQPAGEQPAGEQPAGEQPAGEQPAGEQPGAGDRRPATGMLAELIEERRSRKDLERHVQQLQPVLERLTPDIQRAILEGRVTIAPPEASRAAESARLKDIAETLQLFKVNAQGETVPDLDTAKKVSALVRSEVQAEVAPTRQALLNKDAQVNVDKAVAYAQQHGLDVDIVREEFLSILAQPNGAELLSQSKIAKQVWRGAVGRMHEEGKLTAKEAKKAAAAAPAAGSTAIVTEARGARAGTGAGIQLSPALQRVYQEAGVNPNKSFTASRPNLNFNGPIDLE